MTRADVRAVSAAAMQLERAVEEALAKLRARRITDHRIHQARRALKKARAALRMLRPSLGKRVYRLENVSLRDAGRHLSPLRDAMAMLEAFEAFTTRCGDRLAGADLGPLHRLLELDLVHVRSLVRRPSAPLDACVALLEAHRERLRHALRDGAQDDDATRAIRRVYRKGRKALATAEAAEGSEALHEWRKQVKYLLNAVESVQGGLGPGAGKLLARADKIADLLGEDHDLAVLERFALDHRAQALTAEAADALAGALAHRRRKLQKRAVKLGRRVYQHKARRFLHALLADASTAH